ncbi:MAG: tRNA (adenosine(37)-N6)-dimethylallyltransferase MiaA [Flavobacteriaceae bacterium]|nr:tRNA (adenosine(37)-N6)-dimethylallyltransferase MiaA [Flavobacteriaceae bacterium]
MKKRLISIVGATGIGKTKLAILVAQYFGTEILSCDARQFFREMGIGTAAPDELELSQAKHHFIGNLSIKEDYSIGQYEIDALNKLNELFSKYNEVVLVGGSGMYEKALVEGLNDLPEANEENQKKLQKIWEEEGIEALQQLLKQEDEVYYQVVDKENPRRLLRALDVIWQMGKPYSELINSPKNKRNFEVIRIGIEADREVIYDRINRRVDKMMEQGLLEEARKLLPYRDRVALQTVGYTELFKCFDGEWSLEFAVSEIKKNSRRYAKRQLTWIKKLENVIPIRYDYSQEELEKFLNHI